MLKIGEVYVKVRRIGFYEPAYDNTFVLSDIVRGYDYSFSELQG